MVNCCLYFQVHHPRALNPNYRFFDIGSEKAYFDDDLNRETIRKMALDCYIPANKILLENIKKYGDKFKCSFSFTGIALEQLAEYAPEALDSFKELVDTGNVEILAETYYHSLSFFYNKKVFSEEVKLHSDLIKKTFGVKPTTFRHTELIYNNELAERVQKLGFKVILTEGTESILGWRSPNFLYQPKGQYKLKLLLKNYRMSDDLAFRFSDTTWSDYPLTADKYASWIHRYSGAAETINLFMDYRTFGGHQKAGSGIFPFLSYLPQEVLKREDFIFDTPDNIAKKLQPMGQIDVPNPISWTDDERDLSAWMGNPLQDSALEAVFSLESKIKKSDREVKSIWMSLLSSDHYRFMCDKTSPSAAMNNYNSNFSSPENAYITFNNILTDLRNNIKKKKKIS